MSVVVVTGAASGIGRATAERLLRDGRSVVGVDRDAEGLATLARDGFAGVAGDVVERATHERAADAAAELGTLAGWVNAAGIWAKTRAHDFAEEDVDRVLAVNLKGSILGCSVACARFVAVGGGAIVNVSSIEAVVAFPDAIAYEASKGGIDAITRQVAVDYGPAGIRCNGVRPGAIMTPLADVYLDAYDEDREAMLQSWRDLSPLGLVGEPEDVAAVIAFLLSDEARFVSGTLVDVDAGATARCFRYPPAPDIGTAP
ncbi:MAG TPA: SDR family oxidoreductase [Gaiellaceae bacterium]|nr:SDR family oxidoreductase [Gaiellaceae bacterium]